MARTARPWYSAEKGCYMAHFGGKKVRLIKRKRSGTNRKKTASVLRELRKARKATPDPDAGRHAVASVIEHYLRLNQSRYAAGVGDAGEYKTKENDIIQASPDGRREVRFRTERAAATPARMRELVERWHDIQKARPVHPLVALGAFNLDFLCIHPFRDGNGRVSRLLLMLQCYHLGREVGRSISLERLIEQNKERYYETLKLGSQGWHEGKHDT